VTLPFTDTISRQLAILELLFSLCVFRDLFFASRFQVSIPGQVSGASTNGKGIWVKWWAASNVQYPYEKSGYYMGMYAMLGVLALITLCISCWYVPFPF
jgi:hypothetical protein